MSNEHGLGTRDEWDAFVAGRPTGDMRQCHWWAEPLGQYGVRTNLVTLRTGTRLIGGALFRVLRIPVLGSTVLECQSGPVLTDWEKSWASLFLDAVSDAARASRSLAVALRFCPDPTIWHDLIEAFRSRGCSIALSPEPDEAVLTLAGRTMEDIRAGYSTLTRRNVRKATKNGLRVVTLDGPEQLRAAHTTWMASAYRKQFHDVRPWPAMEPLLRRAIAGNDGFVLGSYQGDRLLASIFVALVGDTAHYMYGGYLDGTERYRPNHILHDAAIQRSLALGKRAYDFGDLLMGVGQTPEGTDRFKLAFGSDRAAVREKVIWERRPLLYRGLQRLRYGSIGCWLENQVRKRMNEGHRNG